MTSHFITATFANGDVVTRRSGAAYTYASRRQIGTQAGRGRTVRFHTCKAAALAAAGRYGEVVRTDLPEPAPKAPEVTTWRVTLADGSTHDVATEIPPRALSIAAAETGKVAISASRVKA